MKYLVVPFGFLVPAQLAWGAEVVDVDVAEARGCALYDDGAVYCWGEWVREAPRPFTAERVVGLPPATAVAVGRFGACAIAMNRALWCWGAISKGRFAAAS